MKYPITMSCTIVALDGGMPVHAYVSVGESDPSPIRITLDFPLGVLDSPENLQDFARQALAAVCETL